MVIRCHVAITPLHSITGLTGADRLCDNAALHIIFFSEFKTEKIIAKFSLLQAVFSGPHVLPGTFYGIIVCEIVLFVCMTLD